MQACVMAPLKITNDDEWKYFCNNINTVRTSLKGVSQYLTVSTDVWWGLVQEEHPEKYDWSYYDRLSYTLKCISDERPDLPEINWAPIMSFHQCGGNVGDNIYIKIPKWAITNREFISDNGNKCQEYVSFWHDNDMLPYYTSFIKTFCKRYSDSYYSVFFKKICVAPSIVEINVSCGPAGELRYPSYNSHDNYQYPEYGHTQAKSHTAIERFQQNYSECNQQIINSTYIKQNYRDTNNHLVKKYLTWYNNELILHGQRMIQAALDGINGTKLYNCRIGIKIPGIHWNSNNNINGPRLSELFAGLIPINDDSLYSNFSNNEIESGYTRIIWALSRPQDMPEIYQDKHRTTKFLIDHPSKLKPNPLYIRKGYNMSKCPNNIKSRERLDLNIHFTCAEMPSLISCDTIEDKENKLHNSEWHIQKLSTNISQINPYSKPRALVKHLAWCGQQIPSETGLKMGVENALAGLSNDKWENIRHILDKNNYGDLFKLPHKNGHSPFAMINILRVDDAAQFSNHYRDLIKDFSY
ncbi:glycosyl hydrolase family 14 [Allofrancisella inopinata]|uniref:Beta-amylase n=1 Tax=Allofrancisella inopinata TaxID=1085647 RepID=A0AAE6YGW8_9GAMM|nr:family 14 glycosylhydrolase [Allofrancisella inopinata]QIV95361.1 glycosyl hydrolase family protein [Allofrancisella inopinata]TDT70422.1 glycosyl hydrolase family 14 [Allofrancisella inopinata]